MLDPTDLPAPGPRRRLTIGHAMALVAASAVASWIAAAATRPNPPAWKCNLPEPPPPRATPGATTNGPGPVAP